MLTFAFCTFNRAARLPALIESMRAQQCSLPFEVLVVDNNSTDDTPATVAQFVGSPGVAVRYVRETEQGIPYARNRAIAEAMDSEILVFVDDDEIPLPGLLESAVTAIRVEGALCAGGKVKVNFGTNPRPAWLTDDLLGFLAEVDYGDDAFWIRDIEKPIWTANVAYDMRLFRDDPSLRFDARYNRRGNGVGGGSDAVMFKEMLARNVPMRYSPGMVVLHYVDHWRLRRRYFLKLHFVAGRKYGQFETGDYPSEIFGVPPFMCGLAFRHALKTATMLIGQQPGLLRQAMNATNALGMMWGRILRHRERHRASVPTGT